MFRAFLNYGFGSYLPQLVSFGLTPVYTHYIAPAEMGWVELYVSASTILVILMRFGLPGAVSRLYFDHGESQSLRDLVTTLAIVLVALSLIMGALAWLGGPWIVGRFAPGTPISPYLEITILTAIFQAAPELQRRLLQVRERSAFSAKLNVVFGVTATLLNVLFVLVLELSALGVLLATLVTTSLQAAVAIYNHRADLRGRFSRVQLQSAFEYGLPLVPHHASAWVNQYAGRWVIASAVSTVALGNLALAIRVASPMSIALTAFFNAYNPVYNSWRKGLDAADARAHVERVNRAALAGGGLLVIGASTVGVWVTRHWMSPAYAAAAPLVGFVGLAVLAQLVYSLLVIETFYAKSTRWVSISMLIAAPTSVAALVLLAPRWGPVAAPICQAFGALISAAIVGSISRRTFPIALPLGATLTTGLISVAAALLPSFWPRLGWAADLALTLAAFAAAAALLLTAVGWSLAGEMTATLRSRIARKLRRRG